MTIRQSHRNEQHPSIPEKVYRILAWLTNPDSQHALLLYGPGGSGKSLAFWEAIEQLKQMTPAERPLPKEVTLLQEGVSTVVFTLRALHEHLWEHHHFSHHGHNHNNILEGKTVIIVMSDHLPHGMADLLCADVMKFERE